MAAGMGNRNSVGSHRPRIEEEELRLLYNYLRISPLYSLASDQMEVKVRRAMPLQTRAVIQCYRRYGDVYHRSFDEWVGSAREVSGKTTPRAHALLIDKALVGRLELGFKLIAVREDLSAAEAAREVSLLIRRCGSFPERPTAITGTRAKTMWRALAVVYARARDPAAELWRIGARVGVIDRFAGRIDPDESRKSAASMQMRKELTQTVIRFLQLALLLSQSAALGTFPDTKSPLIDANQQLVFAFENWELDRALSACAAEYDFVVAKSLELAPKRAVSSLD